MLVILCFMMWGNLSFYCFSESSSFPSGVDIATLHANMEDDVTVIFAVVGVGSISYVQMNPTDLPVYIPCNDLG